jgi:hypothetical protein
VRELAEAHPNFGEFLNRFTTEFGQPIVPSVFICRDDAPSTYRGVDAIAGFRDAIAMSVILQSWAKVLRFGSNMGIKYSDYFAVYPWMLDKNFEHLVTRTLNMLSFHQVSELRAQSSAALSREFFDTGPLDEPLLKGLLARWQRSFSTATPQSDDIKLFRSLTLAMTTCTAIRSAAIVLSWRQQNGHCTTMRRYSIEWRWLPSLICNTPLHQNAMTKLNSRPILAMIMSLDASRMTSKWHHVYRR